MDVKNDKIDKVLYVPELKDFSNTYKKLLNKKPLRGDEVLNGIAYNSLDGQLYLTGKDWNVIFNIEFLN